VVDVKWHGSTAIELTYKDPSGTLGNQLLFRDNEPVLEIVEADRPWSFDGDGSTFRLVSEAHRIRLAHLFDPVLAVHTSVVDPLPHHITRSTTPCSLVSLFASYLADPRAKELFNRYKLPAFHDPFAGGGTLPLEAQRLGFECYATDLNPVAVLINTAMIAIPPSSLRSLPLILLRKRRNRFFEKHGPELPE
jgi:hypothetical protein